MGQDTATALKKLIRAVTAVAEDITHLRADIVKLDGRVAFIENKITGIDRRLDHEANRRDDERTAERNIELEPQVFGAVRPPRTPKTPSARSKKCAEAGRRQPANCEG
jgi:hypothetical protein